VSPIYTRPIREQAEHDRVIRQLQIRYKRKHEVAINPGAERNQAVMVGNFECFPDLVLYSTDRSRKLEGTVEVETGESVHLMEARAEWGVFSKLKVPFHLYVPPQSIESARRMCEEQQFPVAEIWTYHMALDQVRFTQVYRSPNAPKPSPTPAPRAAVRAKPASKATPEARPESKAATSAAKVTRPAPNKAVSPVKTAVKSAAKAVVKAVVKAVKPAKAESKAARAVDRVAARPMAKSVAKSKPVKPAARAVPAKKRR
jgi:hypothetical protein